MFSKYNYVYQVYKENSFTKAAQKLFISQPSLSAAVKSVENKLGAELFERSGNKIKLTQIGKEYIASAEKILAIENEFTNKLNDIYNLQTGNLVVGGTNYFSSYILPQIVNSFTSKYPDINVTLVENNSENLCQMIKEESVDIVIDSFDNTMDEYEGIPLKKERILLCVPENAEINKKLVCQRILPEDIYYGKKNLSDTPAVSIDVFKNEKFILLKKGNDMYNRAMEIFSQKEIQPKVAFYLDQLNISYALAESGLGLCFLTDTFFKYRNYGKNVVLYNVEQEQMGRTLYVAYKRNKYCTRAMQEFIKVSKEIIK